MEGVEILRPTDFDKDYSLCIFAEVGVFLAVFLLIAGRCYGAETCAILLLLRWL